MCRVRERQRNKAKKKRKKNNIDEHFSFVNIAEPVTFFIHFILLIVIANRNETENFMKDQKSFFMFMCDVSI